jgi:hypothetical protein
MLMAPPLPDYCRCHADTLHFDVFQPAIFRHQLSYAAAKKKKKRDARHAQRECAIIAGLTPPTPFCRFRFSPRAPSFLRRLTLISFSAAAASDLLFQRFISVFRRFAIDASSLIFPPATLMLPLYLRHFSRRAATALTPAMLPPGYASFSMH